MKRKKLNLAIIGYGFVGKAVDYGFPQTTCTKTIIDPFLFKNSIQELQTIPIDVSFVCVPTPMGKDASIDASILVKCVQELLEYTKGLIVIKSTVIPSIIDELTKDNRVIYNPEFLTEKSANEDFVNPIMHVFGGDSERTTLLESLYKTYSSCKPCPIYHMSAAEASFVKYGMNTFLMSKVLWFNQFYDIVTNYGSNYSTVINAIGTDPRIGSSHTMVPGHDGRLGAGGSCFAKDGPAFVKFSKEQNKHFTILEEIIKRNQEIRNSYPEPLEREKAQNIRFDYDI